VLPDARPPARRRGHCRSLLATRSKRPQLSPTIDTLPDPTPPTEGERNLAEEVGLALGGMRDDYRRAFLLFHEQELSYAEIGELLGCPIGTVKTWVHRARRELVDQLRARGVVEGISPCGATNLKHA
jgi:RNA polymerase sigma-70 factor, ECF subfamily